MIFMFDLIIFILIKIDSEARSGAPWDFQKSIRKMTKIKNRRKSLLQYML